ncbi:MAG: calcium-binding protein [Xenococcaceae cyanobacterium]
MKIKGTENPDYLQGTNENDKIIAKGGDDTIVSSAGNDAIDGGVGNDTLDLQNLGVSITGTFGTSVTPPPYVATSRGIIDSSLGRINSAAIETVIAPIDQINTIDQSKVGTSIINLEQGRVSDINTRFGSSTNIQNFVNAIGGRRSDTITGNSANNSLTGANGYDKLEGKDGDDTLLGTNAELKGAGEKDTLTGGGGADRFILGDAVGAYYKTNGNNDFVSITDFGAGDLIQLGTGDTYSVVRNDSGFDLFVTTGGAYELIANVQSVGSGSNNQSFGIASAGDVLIAIPEGNFQINSGETLGGIFVGA